MQWALGVLVDKYWETNFSKSKQAIDNNSNPTYLSLEFGNWRKGKASSESQEWAKCSEHTERKNYANIKVYSPIFSALISMRIEIGLFVGHPGMTTGSLLPCRIAAARTPFSSSPNRTFSSTCRHTNDLERMILQYSSSYLNCLFFMTASCKPNRAHVTPPWNKVPRKCHNVIITKIYGTNYSLKWTYCGEFILIDVFLYWKHLMGHICNLYQNSFDPKFPKELYRYGGPNNFLKRLCMIRNHTSKVHKLLSCDLT